MEQFHPQQHERAPHDKPPPPFPGGSSSIMTMAQMQQVDMMQNEQKALEMSGDNKSPLESSDKQ